MGTGFGNSFEKAFSVGQSKGADAALEAIKEKIKTNDEHSKSKQIINVLHSNIAQRIKSGDLTPEHGVEVMKSLDKLGNQSPEVLMSMAKLTDPSTFNTKDPVAQQMQIDRQTQQGMNEQDRLGQNARQALLSTRGDPSIARVEVQRDASATAYRTIQEIKDEKRTPSQVEYYDILGQLWKARTGSSPTDQAIRDLDASTFKGNLAKAAQYFTGKPAGVTTPEILDNIQSFARKTGEMADEMHAGYMAPHLIKPKNLDQATWDEIASTARGLSFKDAAGIKNSPDFKSYEDAKKANLPDGTPVTINGVKGKWYK